MGQADRSFFLLLAGVTEEVLGLGMVSRVLKGHVPVGGLLINPEERGEKDDEIIVRHLNRCDSCLEARHLHP